MPSPGEDRHLVLLHQHGDAVDQLLDDLTLAGHHLRRGSELDRRDVDAVIGEAVAGCGEELARLEQGL